ncbi:hypothetical protein Tco_1182473 [Tanacetum coccineum]
MPVVRFHCPFVGLSGCQDGGGNGLTKTSLITHLHDRHCSGEAQAITKHYLLTDLAVFERAELTLKRSLDKVICKPDDISCWVSLLVLPLCLLKTFRPRTFEGDFGMPGGTLSDVDDEDLDLGERNIKQCKREICDGHYTAAVRVLSSYSSSSGVAPCSDATFEDLKTKHPFQPAPSLPHIPIDHHPIIASSTVVLDRIKSFPRGTSCGRDGLRTQHLMDCLSGAAVAVSDELISFITQMVNIFLVGKCPQILD